MFFFFGENKFEKNITFQERKNYAYYAGFLSAKQHNLRFSVFRLKVIMIKSSLDMISGKVSAN